MTDPHRQFRSYYVGTQDPYGVTPEVLQNTYAPVAALTPSLMGITVTTTYPLAFLVGASGGRIYPIVAPFDQPVLPGQGTPRKYGLIGDLTVNGNLPSLIEITNDSFHLTGNQPVPAIADMTNRWTALPDGDHYLAPEVAGANGAENVRMRYLVPIPHRYIAIILEAYDNSELTWRWMWEHVGDPITQDPAQLQSYTHFINYLRVSSTRRAGVNAGDAARLPGSVFEVAAALVPASVNERITE